ncbi:MAG: N-acetyl-gamma-glutamyl-phosphate reductase [Woeseiaceae bacterium]
MSIAAVVLGATGYVGGEILRLIGTHPHFRLAAAVSESRGGDAVADVFPNLAGLYPGMAFARPDTWLEELDRGSDLALFSAAPHGASAPGIAAALAGATDRGIDVHVVDSSADFRYASASAYEAVYGIPHPAPALIPEFFSAVPEHAPAAEAPHAGHPGCFATAVLLAAVPLVKSGLVEDEFFVSGITGSTGSGRNPQSGTHHPERHSNLYAYKPLSHRHVPEIEASIEKTCNKNAAVHFVPHSGPFARGIYVTLQARMRAPVSSEEVRLAVQSLYEDSEFVRVIEQAPRLKDVVACNDARISVTCEGNIVVVISAIDNLVKGAAGGAMQWMNRLWSLPESSGLTAASPAWT